MTDALWSLAYLSDDADDELINKICEHQVIFDNLIKFMGTGTNNLVPALRAIGNILTSSDD